MLANADVELELARGISEVLRELGLEILPDGYQCEVHLHRGNRKKRRDAEFQKTWDPDEDSIRIGFSRIEEAIEQPATTGKYHFVRRALTEDWLSDLVRALDRAERRPGYEFVSLKWFRDNALLHEGFSWAADEFARHNALRDAIDRRWILTSKVANPRPPNFPVTAIRLNRQMPEVNAILGSGTVSLCGFRPVPIRGEPLSATVLRDRR
jgi:hypothetical protein